MVPADLRSEPIVLTHDPRLAGRFLNIAVGGFAVLFAVLVARAFV